MELSNFIRQHKEEISNEWIKYAQNHIKCTSEMELKEVTNDIKEMLDRIASDMETSQTDAQQELKSKGDKELKSSQTKAARTHGAQRMDFGFDIVELSSEFRALRASVLRLWTKKSREENWEAKFHDMVRFNEAIDEIWMISLMRFQEKIDKSKSLFLGVLGHDLRSPVFAISGVHSILKFSENLSKKEKEVLQVADFSLKRMTELINNLLELTEFRLGKGMSLEKNAVNLLKLCEDVVEELRLGNPEKEITLESKERIEGEWDASRLEQMMTNLITNALRHGDPDGVVKVNLSVEEKQAIVKVHNDGPPIPEDIRNKIFSYRFTRSNKSTRGEKSYGLGLYIVNEIVEGHQGKIEVKSTKEEGTTFIVKLPLRLES